MLNASKLKELIFHNQLSFQEQAKLLFNYQFENCSVYQTFINQLHSQYANSGELVAFPFLPIELFKTHKIIDQKLFVQKVFKSSGTTGSINSKHYIADLKLYHESILKGFKEFYGAPEDFVFFCLLPSYLERNNSSLVFMFDYLIEKSSIDAGGFYLFNYSDLIKAIESYKGDRTIFLVGVSFALWEMAENHTNQLI